MDHWDSFYKEPYWHYVRTMDGTNSLFNKSGIKSLQEIYVNTIDNFKAWGYGDPYLQIIKTIKAQMVSVKIVNDSASIESYIERKKQELVERKKRIESERLTVGQFTFNDQKENIVAALRAHFQ